MGEVKNLVPPRAIVVTLQCEPSFRAHPCRHHVFTANQKLVRLIFSTLINIVINKFSSLEAIYLVSLCDFHSRRECQVDHISVTSQMGQMEKREEEVAFQVLSHDSAPLNHKFGGKHNFSHSKSLLGGVVADVLDSQNTTATF